MVQYAKRYDQSGNGVEVVVCKLFQPEPRDSQVRCPPVKWNCFDSVFYMYTRSTLEVLSYFMYVL